MNCVVSFSFGSPNCQREQLFCSLPLFLFPFLNWGMLAFSDLTKCLWIWGFKNVIVSKKQIAGKGHDNKNLPISPLGTVLGCCFPYSFTCFWERVRRRDWHLIKHSTSREGKFRRHNVSCWGLPPFVFPDFADQRLLFIKHPVSRIWPLWWGGNGYNFWL